MDINETFKNNNSLLKIKSSMCMFFYFCIIICVLHFPRKKKKKKPKDSELLVERRGTPYYRHCISLNFLYDFPLLFMYALVSLDGSR